MSHPLKGVVVNLPPSKRTKSSALPFLALIASIVAIHPAQGQSTDDASFARPGHFTMESGEALYTGICQACHMPDGKGAKGAGTYPRLANNDKLESSDYPVAMVLGGHAAMPNFGPSLSDDQVASVVGYIRTHFGNSYGDPVRPSDVAEARKALAQ